MSVRFVAELMGDGLVPDLDDPAGLIDRTGKAPCIRIASIEQAISPDVRRIMESALRP
jgi:hypothetical protein